MANVNAPDGFTYERRHGSSGVPPIKRFPQAEATTLNIGDPVTLVNGLLVLANATAEVVGIVMGNADRIPGDADDRIYRLVQLTGSDIVFSVQTDDEDIGLADVGSVYAHSGTTGEVVLSTASTAATGAWKVVGLRDYSEWGDYARVEVVCVNGFFG